MRVLVAGGAGFIGSHLCDRLLSQGHHVIAVDNLITGRAINIEHLLDEPRFTLIHHDVTMPIDLEVDRIYHLASPASPVGYMKHPIETHLANSLGTLNLLRLAARVGARFLFASTSEAYGDPTVHPQPETYHGNVNPVGPRSCYDESKRFGESITMEFLRQYGTDVRVVRIFNTYGPRNDPADGRVVPNFIIRALRADPIPIYGDGGQTRSLCYVTDMIQGLELAMEASDARGEVINLGNPDERTVVEIALLIKQLCHSPSPIIFEPGRPDDPSRRQPDIRKARRLLGWEPAVEIEPGMRQTIAYFREHGENEPHAAERA